MRKLTALILALAVVLLLFSCGENTEYEYYVTEDNQGVVITSYLGTDVEVVIPETIKGKPVIEVADGAFADSLTLRRVTVPATVSEITERAFEGCDNLCCVFFMGDAPTAYSVSESRMGWYTVYFREDAKGIPSEMRINGDTIWQGYYALLIDDGTFSRPFANVIDGKDKLSVEGVRPILEKVPTDRYEVYPHTKGKPVSARLYRNGTETEIDIGDPRLIKMLNFYHNSVYNRQHAYSKGALDPKRFEEREENDPYRLVVTFDDGLTNVIVNKYFLDVYYDSPYGGGLYPYTVYSRYPFYLEYPWLDLFGFGE